MVHMPPVSLEQSCDPAVAIATILAGQLNDRRGERVFIVELLRLPPLR